MAFTATQIVQIRKFMGFALTSETGQESLLEAIAAVGASSDAQAIVEAILAELTALDLTLATSGSSASYGALKKVDEVEFYSPSSGSFSSTPNDRAAILTCRLARILGVDAAGDYFTSCYAACAGVIAVASDPPRWWPW